MVFSSASENLVSAFLPPQLVEATDKDNRLRCTGPGNCMGLLASKTSPTAIRGQYYGVAAAIGKVGAFVGTWGKCNRSIAS
jgi:hypothetical protein